jgi:hypothetical protein
MRPFTRRPRFSPPKKSLAYLDEAVFVVDGQEVKGQEFVKVYERAAAGQVFPGRRPAVERHALAWLVAQGHLREVGCGLYKSTKE